MEGPLQIDKKWLLILNQVFDMEQKVNKIQESNSLHRNLNKLKSIFEFEVLPDGFGLHIHNPVGEPYDETRTDCEASISGNKTENLVIREVIKPIIRVKKGEFNMIVQPGVVVVSGE